MLELHRIGHRTINHLDSLQLLTELLHLQQACQQGTSRPFQAAATKFGKAATKLKLGDWATAYGATCAAIGELQAGQVDQRLLTRAHRVADSLETHLTFNERL